MGQKTDARGYTWCTPGAYVRRSMLRLLAGEVSDHYLPEACYENSFTQSKNTPIRSDDEKKVLAMSLGLRMKEEGRSRFVVDEDDEDGVEDCS